MFCYACPSPIPSHPIHPSIHPVVMLACRRGGKCPVPSLFPSKRNPPPPSPPTPSQLPPNSLPGGRVSSGYRYTEGPGSHTTHPRPPIPAQPPSHSSVEPLRSARLPSSCRGKRKVRQDQDGIGRGKDGKPSIPEVKRKGGHPGSSHASSCVPNSIHRIPPIHARLFPVDIYML